MLKLDVEVEVGGNDGTHIESVFSAVFLTLYFDADPDPDPGHFSRYKNYFKTRTLMPIRIPAGLCCRSKSGSDLAK
jgi:hypothetical protein